MHFYRKLQTWAVPVFALSLAATALFPLRAFAQTSTTGSINGTVVDSSGAAVPNAAVIVKDTVTGAVLNLTTNADGRFVASFLNPDKFEISATAASLKSATTSLQVLTGQQSVVNVTVSPMADTQTVQVSANDAQLIDTQTSNLTTTFTTQQFENLPAPGGDITTIAYTVPGVVVGAGTNGFGAFTSDGLPGLSNLVIIDGADYAVGLYNIAYSGSSNVTIGQQEIAQASVVQNGYSVQYGRQAGVIETYATKSGANRLHGLLQYQYNSSGLNANDFFNNLVGNPKSKAVSNQYAAQIGGPIKHDKLFFFVDTEGIRFIEPSTGFVNLPSPALQSSILANPSLSAGSRSLYGAMFKGTNASPAFARAVPVTNGAGPLQDLNNTNGCGSLAGTPDYATGGTLGSSTAESCVDTAFVNATALNREWLLAGRIDWNVSDRQKVFFRVTTDQGSQPSFVSLINSDWNVSSNQPSWTGQMNHTYSFSPTLTNQFVLAALYYSGVFKPTNLQAALAASPTEFDEPNDGGSNSLAGIGQRNFFTLSTTLGTPWIDFPGGVNNSQYQAVDNLSWLKGTHNIKFGIDFKRTYFTDTVLQTASYGGDYAFSNLASEASGSLTPTSGSSFTQGFPRFGNIHSTLYNFGIYAQDEWRATPRLALDYGLRVDRTGNPICNDACYSHYVGGFPAAFSSGVSPLDVPYNATLSAGHKAFVPGIEAAIVQPRAGFNFDIAGDGKTILRGGVGLFADSFPALILEQTYFSFPNRFFAPINTGTVAQDAGSAYSIAAASAAAVLNGFSQGATYNQLAASVPGFSPPNYATTPQNFHSARYLEYSMQLQRQITQSDALIFSYAGNHGYNLFIANNHLNQSVAGTAYASYGDGTFGGLPATQADPRFALVQGFTNNAISNYNGVSAQYKHIDRRGLTTDIAYTYSHSLDDISNGGNTQLPYNTGAVSSQITPGLPSALMYSNSDYDIRHNFVMDIVYAEPYRFGNAILNAVGGGWTAGAKAYWRSGEPFSVFNSNATNTVAASANGGATVLAEVLNNNFSHHCTSYSQPCFQNFGVFNGTGLTTATDPNTGATTIVPANPTLPGGGTLAQPVQTSFGNFPRNSFYGPHYADVDINLYKSLFKRGDNLNFQVGASAYNAFNHVNFGQPQNNASSLSNLGKISTDINAPTSPYGSSQQPTVAARVVVVQGRLVF